MALPSLYPILIETSDLCRCIRRARSSSYSEQWKGFGARPLVAILSRSQSSLSKLARFSFHFSGNSWKKSNRQLCYLGHFSASLFRKEQDAIDDFVQMVAEAALSKADCKEGKEGELFWTGLFRRRLLFSSYAGSVIYNVRFDQGSERTLYSGFVSYSPIL